MFYYFSTCSVMCVLVATQMIQHQITQQRKIGSFIQFTTVGFESSSLNKDKCADSWQAVSLLQRMCGIQDLTQSLCLSWQLEQRMGLVLWKRIELVQQAINHYWNKENITFSTNNSNFHIQMNNHTISYIK